MTGSPEFVDVLGRYVNRAGYTAGQLARLSGVPKRTIVNWLEGRVRKPRGWQDLVKLAKALRLVASELDELLQSASCPSVSELLASVDNDKDRSLLLPWTVTSLHQLSSPPRDFTGREAELTELMAHVKSGGVTLSGLHGMGGVGKTVLALKLAEQLTPRYPDAQFYLDLKGASEQKPLTVADALSHVIRAYNPTAKLPENEAELRGLYQSVLHRQRALLLMDNARDAAQVEPLIPPPSSFLLVTSRQHFTLSGLFATDLNTLPPADSHAFLLKITPRIGNFVDEIAKLCGYLPLALRLAGSAFAERIDLSPERYVQRLKDARTRLELIDASLSLSYDLLTPKLQGLWCMLAIFPETFDAAAAAAVWQLEPDPAQDALSELVKYSLVEWSALPFSVSDRELGVEVEMGRYRLHDLVRLFADTRLSKADRAIGEQRHAAHYVTILHEVDELYDRGGEALRRSLALFDLEWRNIQTGQAWAAMHIEEDETAVNLCSAYANEGRYMLHLRLPARERIRWRELALSAARRLKDRRSEEVHLGQLGLAYSDLGEIHRAIEFYERSLDITREIGHRISEALVLNNLGNAYADLGESHRAIEFYKSALVIAREVGNHRTEASLLSRSQEVFSTFQKADFAVFQGKFRVKKVKRTFDDLLRQLGRGLLRLRRVQSRHRVL